MMLAKAATDSLYGEIIFRKNKCRFDYFGKELDIGKLKFKRTKNIEEKIKEKLEENQPI